MKSTLLILSLLCTFAASSQTITISGKVTNEDNEPIAGATITIKQFNHSTITGKNGSFTIEGSRLTDTLIISAIGYETKEEYYTGNSMMTIILKLKITALGEVIVSTGYQNLNKERSTGSFEKINTALLNRAVSTNWLSRLEGVSSVYFDKRANAQDDITIRGRSTIFANADPLIILDNFPYEGTIENINPNDIESITILKDAAAASIWGARAGNGVIVITTKKGNYKRKPSLQFNLNTIIGDKPDLFYSPDIASSDFIDVETFLFGKGFYNGDINNSTTRPPLTPVVEMLAKRRAGQISAADSMNFIDAMRNYDYRNDMEKYFYQRSVSQQYAISYSGGEEKVNYFFSAGYDKIKTNFVNNSNERFTLSSRLSVLPVKFLELGLSVSLTELGTITSIGSNISPGGNKASLYPYARFADDQGNPLSIVKDYRYSFIDTAGGGKLLDWKYRPMQELYDADNNTQQSNKRIGVTVGIKINKNLSVDLLYQYENETQEKRNHFSQNTYFTRNLINRYYNPSAANKYGIPLGGILDQTHSSLLSHNARLQTNYNGSWSGVHEVSAIAGAEIKQTETGSNNYRVYGYSDDVLTHVNVNYVDNFPTYAGLSSAQIIPNPAGFSGGLLRYISGYANAAYTYRKKHTISLSVRKDASNIFGVTANQKWVPLWSSGYGWQLNKEKFYKLSWLPSLKFRVTYGYNGNVDNTLSAFTTIRYVSNALFTGQQYAQIRSQPNPELRWEKTGLLNLALDFSFRNDRVSGTIEYYWKNGKDLIGFAPIDPTTGVQDIMQRFAFKGNVAAMKGNGVELALNTENIKGAFNWSTNFLFNYAATRVTDYVLVNVNASSFLGLGLTVNPIPGKPLYSIYSYRWAGLDPANGDPQGLLNGTISKDYTALTGVTVNDLVYNGSAVPEIFGSLRNTFRYKIFTLSANIVYKLGYYFKRPSINYNTLFTTWRGHADFANRWKKPGDEIYTNTPSMIYPNSNANRDNFYSASEVLVEKGDHIRLQDIALSWDINIKKKWPFKNMQLYAYINNIGIIWKANNAGLDPDYFSSGFPLPITCAIGFKTNF